MESQRAEHDWATRTHILVLMWNVSGLNTPVKRDRCETITNNPIICYLQETYLKYKNTEMLKDEKRYNASTNQNKVGVYFD